MVSSQQYDSNWESLFFHYFTPKSSFDMLGVFEIPFSSKLVNYNKIYKFLTVAISFSMYLWHIALKLQIIPGPPYEGIVSLTIGIKLGTVIYVSHWNVSIYNLCQLWAEILNTLYCSTVFSFMQASCLF